MALKKCKECGSSLSPQADRCPNCDAPTTRRKHRIGCITSIVIFLISVVLFSYLFIFLPDRAEKRKELELAKIEMQKEKELQEKRRIEDEEKNRIEQEKKNQENVFLQNIEKHYRKVQALYSQGKFHESHKEIDHFIKYDKLDYKDTEEIYRKLTIKKLDAEVRKIPASEVRENLHRYKELLDLDPSNARYKKKVAYYQKKVEEKLIQEAQNNLSGSMTILSKKASGLKIGMKRKVVISLFGHASWAVMPGDKGDLALPDPRIKLELYWKNTPCSPVAVQFDSAYKVIGWDEGRASCGEDAYFLEPPDDYSCAKADRSNFCR